MKSVLDFNDKGGATIEVPQIGDYSFVENLWVRLNTQLQDIDVDLQQSDSLQRTNFLKKYAEVIRQNTDSEPYFICKGFSKFGLDEEDEGLCEEPKTEMEKQTHEYIENRIIEHNYHQIYNMYTYKDARIYKDAMYVYNVSFKHSLAWYLMNRIDSELEKVERKIEMQKGILSIPVEDFMKVCRSSSTPYELHTNLMNEFSITFQQALLSEVLMRELYIIVGKRDRLEFFEFQKSFLEKIKSM